jgi:HK97 family phage major capsid protein
VQYLQPEYNPCWMMHPTIKAILAQQTSTLSGERQYPSVAEDNTLLGYEIVANSDMASAFASNSLTLAFGSFQQNVVITQAPALLCSDYESRAEYNQGLWNLLHRQSAKVVNADATRILKQHA